MRETTFRLLPLVQLRQNARSILGNVELMATRFVITDTPGVMGELRQLTKSAEQFLTGTDAQPCEAADLLSNNDAATTKGESVAPSDIQLLPLTQLKRARRALLGKIEHAGTRFIVTDYGQAVAELGPLSKSAREFMARLKEERRQTIGRRRARGSAEVRSTRDAGGVRERGYAR